MLLYYNPFKMQAKVDAKVKREDIERLKKKLLDSSFEKRVKVSGLRLGVQSVGCGSRASGPRRTRLVDNCGHVSYEISVCCACV